MSCTETKTNYIIVKEITGTVSDFDGNTYKTIKIGNEWWMAENLKTTHFRDGSAIPLVTDNDEWYNLTTPAYSWYNNDISNKDIYGALYNWYTVNSGKLCPWGWHVPTDDAWSQLEVYLGAPAIWGVSPYSYVCLWGIEYVNAGSKLKEAGPNHWNVGLNSATNESGFTALPGGVRDYWDGSGTWRGFFFKGEIGKFWTSSENNTFGVSHIIMSNNGICRHTTKKSTGLSMRCIKD